MASKLEILIDVLLGKSKANLDSLNKSLKQTGDAGEKSSSQLGKTAKSIASTVLPAVTAGAAIMALGKFLGDSVTEAAEAEKIQAQLGAVLESTGGSAGMTSDAVNRLATELSNMSGVEDDTIVKAEAMMLTFTKVGEDVFPQAIEAALNLSRAYGIDLQSAVLMVGKALSEPEKGMGMLTRKTGELTDEQKKLIDSFMAVGDEASAQMVILGKLETAVGGAAEAYGETYAGQVDKLRNAWGNFKEEVGGKVIPVLTDLLEAQNLGTEAANLMNEAIDAGLITMWEGMSILDEYGRNTEGSAKAIEHFNDILEPHNRMLEAQTGWMGMIPEKAGPASAAIDDLAGSTEEAGEAAEDAKVAFDAWADGLNTNLANSIDNTLEKLDWLMAGGDKLNEKFTAINQALTLGEITPEQAKTFFESLYVEATLLEMRLGQISIGDAAEQIAEQLGIAIEQAELIIRAGKPAIIPIKVELEQPIDELYQQQLNQFIITDAQAKSMLTPLNSEIDTITQKVEALATDRDFTIEMGANEPYMDDIGNKLDVLSEDRKFNMTMVANKAYMQEILNLVNAIDKDRSFTITANYVTTGTPPGGQHGLNMIVPPGYPNDSFLVAASSGERVKITPGGGSGTSVSAYRMSESPVVVYYSPMFSLTDREHVETELIPIIQKAIRRYG